MLSSSKIILKDHSAFIIVMRLFKTGLLDPEREGTVIRQNTVSHPRTLEFFNMGLLYINPILYGRVLIFFSPYCYGINTSHDEVVKF